MQKPWLSTPFPSAASTVTNTLLGVFTPDTAVQVTSGGLPQSQ
jgi:hypothetical protein